MKPKLDFIKSISFDYSMKTGVTFIVDIAVKEPDGTPSDITGFTFVIAVWNRLTKVTDIHGVIVSAVAGTVHFEVSATNTALLPVGKYIYHLEATSSAGVVARYCEGKFEIRD